MQNKPRIAVICAAHRGNSGMYSVDAAAQAYFSSRPCEFDIFVTQHQKDGPRFTHGDVRVLSDMDQLRDYSHIVYWGDFLNNPMYGQGDYARRDVMFGHSATVDEGYARWQALHACFDKVPGQRILSVGNNFQHNYQKPRHNFAPIFRKLEANFDLILPRDSFSVLNVARRFTFEGMSRVKAGMDCAFLLPPLPEAPREDMFTYFFGRSKLEEPERLVAMVEERTGLRGKAVPAWLRLDHRTAPEDFAASRRQLARSRFVLSDTYHFCINSFILGTPVIGLGRAEVAQNGTLGDFKKRVLFDMLGLQSLYCEAPADMSDNDFYGFIAKKAEAEIARDFNQPGRSALMRGMIDKFREDLDLAIFGAA